MNRARVLIVEDEAVIRLSLEERLEALGHEVVGSAETGAAAIACAGRLRPELVLMDVRLRGAMDGVTAAEEIRRRFAIPSIFLTAFADEQTVARAAATEPLGYLHKPVQDHELRTAIEIGHYRHRMERLLRERERRYAATLGAIGDAVLVTDAAGEVVMLNPAAEVLTGWSGAEARGLLIDEVSPLFRTDTQTRADHPALAVLGRGDPLPPGTPTVLLTRGGADVPVEAVASEIRPVADEPPTGVVLTVRDVSHRNRAERDTRRGERREVVVAMAAGTAHEFANALTPIAGFAGLLRESIGSNPKLREMITRIEDAVGRGHELIRQLQAVTGMRHPRERVDAIEWLARATGELAEQSRAGVTLRLEPTGDRVTVVADLAQFDRLIRILVANASEAIDGSGAIVVSTGVEERTAEAFAGCRGFEPVRGGRYLRITIADTGCGVPAALSERLFVPFFSTKGYGRGLGLVAAEGIVSAHRGAIRLDGSTGSGTRVSVWLPVAGNEQHINKSQSD